MSDMTITKLTGHIGAEISGVDLGKPLTPSVEDAVYQALIDHCVKACQNFGLAGLSLTMNQFNKK